MEHGRVDDVRDHAVATARLDGLQLAHEALADRTDQVGIPEGIAGQQPVRTAHEPALEGREVLAHHDRTAEPTGQQHRREPRLEHMGVDDVGLPARALPVAERSRHPGELRRHRGGAQPRPAIDEPARRQRLGRVVPVPEHAPPGHRLGGERQHPHVVAKRRRARLLPAEQAEHGPVRPRVPLRQDQDSAPHGEPMMAALILLLHNRYRTPGGEERAVEDLAWLIRSELDEAVAVLERDSADARAGARRDRPARRRAAAGGGGGRRAPQRGAGRARPQRAPGVRLARARRRARGRRPRGPAPAQLPARMRDRHLLHARRGLHALPRPQHVPGVRLNCRGSRAESVVYGAALALWQKRLAAAVDAFVVPSEFALERLRDARRPARRPRARDPIRPALVRTVVHGGSGQFALAAGRLTPEKGFADAIAACARAEVPLVVAGDGPQLDELRAMGGDVRFVGHVGPAELASLRRQAGLAIVPSRYQEILPLAALEAMAAGLPVVAARAGGLAEIVPDEGLYPPGDVDALAGRVRALWADAAAGERALAVARERFALP